MSRFSIPGTKNANICCSEDGCEGDGTPPISWPGIENFETAGIYGLYKSWRCDCGDVCEPY
jgi:hypothetical protein